MTYQIEFEKLVTFDNDKDGIFIKVEIKYADSSEIIESKIDTGATYSIFQRHFGEKLGLEIEKGFRQRFSTATGSFYAYGFRVTLIVADIELDSMVFFAENESFNKNVLGRIGWLDNLNFGLIDQKGEIYLSRYEPE